MDVIFYTSEYELGEFCRSRGFYDLADKDELIAMLGKAGDGYYDADRFAEIAKDIMAHTSEETKLAELCVTCSSFMADLIHERVFHPKFICDNDRQKRRHRIVAVHPTNEDDWGDLVVGMTLNEAISICNGLDWVKDGYDLIIEEDE